MVQIGASQDAKINANEDLQSNKKRKHQQESQTASKKVQELGEITFFRRQGQKVDKCQTHMQI
jgi:hypothetical protein